MIQIIFLCKTDYHANYLQAVSVNTYPQSFHWLGLEMVSVAQKRRANIV